MIKIDDKLITDIKLGEQPVIEVYKGEERVWGGVLWNQMIYNGNFAEGLTGYNNPEGVVPRVEDNVLIMYNDPDIVPNNGSISYSANVAKNYIKHDDKLLVMIDCKRDGGTATSILQMTIYGKITYLSKVPTEDWQRYYMFLKATSLEDATSSSISGMIYNRARGYTWYYKNFMVFNLTLMYGKGREPNTLEEFLADYKKWFGKELEYEEYCTGRWLDIK